MPASIVEQTDFTCSPRKGSLLFYVYLFTCFWIVGCKKEALNEKNKPQSLVYLRQQTSAPYQWGIYTSDLTGTNESLVLSSDGVKEQPLWSGNNKIFFLSNYRGEAFLQIYSVDLDGTNLQRVTNCQTCQYSDLKISSRVNRLLYFKTSNGVKTLATSKFNGTDEQTIILPNPAQITQVNWSPDGNKIIYLSAYSPDGVYTSSNNLYSINSNGSEVTNLTNNPPASSEIYKSPFISPDGTRIVYTRANYNLTNGEVYRVGIYTCQIDGSNEQLVFSSKDIHANGNWSNDGNYILVFGYSIPYFIISPDGKSSTAILNPIVREPSFQDFY